MKGSGVAIFFLNILLGIALACGGSLPEPRPQPEQPPERGLEESTELKPEEPEQPPERGLEEPTEPEPEEPELPTEEVSEPPRDEGPDITDALKDEWFFSPGGGGEGCGIYPMPDGVSPPALTLFALRNAQLCLWGFPLDQSVDVKLHAPDGRVFESRYTVIEHEIFGTSSSRLLPSPPGKEVLSFAGEHFQAGTFIEIRVDFPVDLPDGMWLVEASSDRIAAEGLAEVKAPDGRALSVLPPDGLSPFENLCEDNSYGPGDRLNIVGINFPPNQEVALGVYFHPSPDQGLRLVFDTPLLANGDGEIATSLVIEPSDPTGEYWALATADPNTDFSDSTAGGFVYSGAQACFTVQN